MIDRRKFLSIGFIGLSSVALSSCSLTGYYDDKKYGIIDTAGTWIIKPKFDWISHPVKGLCMAFLSRDDNPLRGIVDLSGRWVIEPKWKRTGGFSELDYFGAQDAESGLWGIARKDGSWQVEPYLVGMDSRSGIGYFNPHTQIAEAYDAASDLWGFIDGSGKWVVKPFANYISYIGSDGLWGAIKKGDVLYGLIDIEGNWLLEPKFKVIGDFGKTGYAYAMSAETELGGLIDKQGNWVVEPKFAYIHTPDKSDFIPARECTAEPSGALLWGFIDLSGEWVVEPKYLDICPYNAECDVVSVCLQEKDRPYRLMNSKQEFISDACFSYIFSGFSDDGYCDARPYKLEKPLWE